MAVLESVKISGYRSCLDTTFNPQPDLSVLIGPNGSGKTSILKAILLLHKLSSASGLFDANDFDATDEPELRVGLKHKNQRSTLTLDMSLHADEQNDDVVLGYEPSWEIMEGGKITEISLSAEDFARHGILNFRAASHEKLRKITSFKPQIEDKYQKDFGAMADFFRRMKYYSAAQFVNPAECPVSFMVKRDGRHTTGVRLKGHSRFLFDLYDGKKRETVTYQKFLSVVGPGGLRLVDKIEFQEVETSQTDVSVRSGGALKQHSRIQNMVIPQFHIGGNKLSPNQLSEGTFRTIALFFYIMTDDSSALLIEEPEVCVHQGLLSSLVELMKIYAEQKQIIISTHSDFVLDQVEPRNVYKVSMSPESGAKVSQIEESLSAKELAALKTYLNEEGNLGEYWRQGGLG